MEKQDEDEEWKWKTRWQRREEGGLAPCCLSLNTLRRSLFPSPPSFFFSFTHTHVRTHTRAHTHTRSARLAHEGAVAIKPAQHGAQIERETERGREDSTPHEHHPWKTEMRRNRRREGAREGWVQRGQRQSGAMMGVMMEQTQRKYRNTSKSCYRSY